MPRWAPIEGARPIPYEVFAGYLTRSVLTWFVRESNPDRWIESPARLPLNHGKNFLISENRKQSPNLFHVNLQRSNDHFSVLTS